MSKPHWSQLQEAGALGGLRFMFTIYRYLGRLPFYLVLYPVILYFFLFRSASRRASLEYLQQCRLAGKQEQSRHLLWLSFRQFLNFGESILDKLAGWQGDIRLDDVFFHPSPEFDKVYQQKIGAVIIGSHLGNLEVCRALCLQKPNTKINVLMHTKHAGKFNEMLKQAGSESQINIIQVSDVSPATAMMLNDKLTLGEYIVIAGDRTPVSGEGNVSQAQFLGRLAEFPQGPFILAAILKCPVYTMFCLRTPKQIHRYEIFLDPFREKISLPRKQRQESIHAIIQDYAKVLEKMCLHAPLQWYNFHSIWAVATKDSQ